MPQGRAIAISIGVAVGTFAAIAASWSAIASPGWMQLGLALLGSLISGIWALFELRRRLRSHEPGVGIGFAANAQLRPSPQELPPYSGPFIGRSAETSRILSDLSRSRSAKAGWKRTIAISGAPGVGKSALALCAANQLAPRYKDGQLYVDLNGASADGTPPLNPRQVLSRFLRSLGVRDVDTPLDLGEAAALFRSLTARRSFLIVLDNASDAAQVRPLLAGGNTSAVIVTSRQAMADLDDATQMPLSVLSDTDASTLLLRLANRDARDMGAARRIASMCGYLPLAIRIAGARLSIQPSLSLDTFENLLKDETHRLDLLQYGDRAVLANFETSYKALETSTLDNSREAARVFCLLGVLPGQDFTHDVVAAVSELPSWKAQATIELLVGTHLVETGPEMRFRLHDLLRLYARNKASEGKIMAEAERARVRALRYYLSTCQQADELLRPDAKRSKNIHSRFASRYEALEWLESERYNLVAAIKQADLLGPHDVAWTMASALFRFFNLRKYMNDWLVLTEAALDSARVAGSPQAESTMVHHLSCVLRQQHRFDEAVLYARRSIEMDRALGNRRREGMSLQILGQALAEQKKAEEAVRAYGQALVIFKDVGDGYREAMASHMLGDAYRLEGEPGNAETAYKKSLGLYTKAGDQHGEAIVRHSLGRLYCELNRHSEAAEELNLALSIFDEAQDLYRQGLAHQSIAMLLQLTGEYDAALGHYEKSLELSRSMRDPYEEARSLQGLATVLGKLGKRREAERAQSEASTVLAQLSLPTSVHFSASEAGGRR